MGILKVIELENFKSYKGKLTIGPFKKFTAVIGPNGSGKSNLMDAISFVLGESTRNLRVKKVSDLIHGAPIGKPVSHKAYVTFVYEADDGEETRFTRTIIGTSTEYRVNGRPVSQQEYQTRLEDLNLLIKAKNFLVFQGQVETIAMKSAKERTQVFEEVSRSGELKEDYERLKVEMQKAEEDTLLTMQKKKGLAAQKKEAMMEKDEAEKYQKLKDDLAQVQSTVKLFKLFHTERALEECQHKLSEENSKMDDLKRQKQKMEDDIRQQKKLLGECSRELYTMEQQLKENENELNRARPTFIKAKEKMAHIIKKIEVSKKAMNSAQQINDKHQKEIDALEKELDEVDEQKKKFEKEVQLESLSQGKDLRLEESQIKEYHRLKGEGGRRAAKHQQELDSVMREQKADQDRFENERRREQDVQSRIGSKEKEVEELERRLEKLTEYITSTEQLIEDKKKEEIELSQQVESSRSRLGEIEEEMKEVLSKLGEAKVDRHESTRQTRRRELVEHLKNYFPGVYGRLIDHCNPIHSRYQVAITKVLGKNMDAIIVDTEKTARECIQFMKEQRWEPETFLPIDYLKTKPLDERLREISEPRNVKMVFDVIRFEPAVLRKALQFACGNALVCESDEDARKLGLQTNKRKRTVSLDGTLFEKSGVISGGKSDLKHRAKRWDEKQLDNLKARRQKLTDEMKEQLRNRRKEADLMTIKSQIEGYQTRLKVAMQDREATKNKHLAHARKEIEQLKNQLETIEPNKQAIADKLKKREEKLARLKEKMNGVEDEVFQAFCQQIGVDNIRQYEEREVRAQQDRDKRRMEFENQKSRLQTQLEYERSRDLQSAVSKWARDIEKCEQELKQAEKEEAHCQEEIEKLNQKREKVLEKKAKKKEATDGVDRQLGEKRRAMGALEKELTEVQRQVNALETKCEQQKADRHNLLKSCQFEDIKIPLLRGSIDNAAETDPSQTERASTSDEAPDSLSTQGARQLYEREAEIVVDYAQLPEEHKDLVHRADIEKVDEELQNRIADMGITLQKIKAPNLKATEMLDAMNDRFHETSEEFEKARNKAKRAKVAYDQVRRERFERFNKCFEHVATKIDEIYKSLARNPGAQAFLAAENVEEPYLEGISYNCVAPGKRFRPMDSLSGGEKTVAALALLFAVHSYQPAPFFVLDEIDAALDNTNISKVASFIREQAEDRFQCVVISLKEEFFSRADALIGIYPEPGPVVISRFLTLDLSEYPESGKLSTHATPAKST